MSDWNDDDDEDVDYFSETDVDLTGNEPKFIKLGSMNLTPDVIAAMKVDDLILLYIIARNQLATDRKGYKEREAKIKTHLSIISMTLRDKGDVIGVDSFKTDKGTAYRNKKERFQINDWDSFCLWLYDTKNFQTIQKRVSPNAIKDVRTEEGTLPPGLSCIEEIEFAVRSPTVRKK